MPESDRLPDLPLVLAGLPRSLRDAFRTAGVPSVTAVAGERDLPGRFVLFDSRRARGIPSASAAQRRGHTLVDLAGTGLPEDDMPLSGQQSARILSHIKDEIEASGGVWLRAGDYPFPFESVVCLSADHSLDGLSELARLRDLFPGAMTHFVPTRLRCDWLTYSANMGAGEIGWRVDPEDLLDSPRKTRTHWATRRQRFLDAGVEVRGLHLCESDLPLPGLSSLANMGLRYACREGATHGGTVRDEGEWLNVGSVTLERLAAAGAGPGQFAANHSPEASTILVQTPKYAAGDPSADSGLSPLLSALQFLHQCGRPIFLHDNLRKPDLVAQFLLLRAAAARLPLVWQATLGEFARWWSLRQTLDLRVWQKEGGCAIQARGGYEHHSQSLEIWRGQHRAVLPLTQSSLSLRDEGVAYVHAADRSPAGLVGLSERISSRRPTVNLSSSAHDSWAA